MFDLNWLNTVIALVTALVGLISAVCLLLRRIRWLMRVWQRPRRDRQVPSGVGSYPLPLTVGQHVSVRQTDGTSTSHQVTRLSQLIAVLSVLITLLATVLVYVLLA